MDILIENAHIITGRKDNMYKGRGFIGVTGDKITYIGKTRPMEFLPQKIIKADNMIALPGLQNAHTHAPMVLMRNYVTDLPLEIWLKNYIMPIEDKLTREHLRNGSMLAIAEMIKSGTTAFLDMYFEVDITAEAALEAGIRANISMGLLTSHMMDQGLMKAKKFCRAFYRKYMGKGNGLINTNMEVHSVYLYDEKMLFAAADFARETGLHINIHLHESKIEVQNSIAQYGLSPIMECLKCGILDVPVTAAHTVWMDDGELDIMKEKNVRPVHNPSSNMMLGSGLAPIAKMLEKGIPIALGTDSAASNNDMDMFGEMHMAGLLHKGRELDATVVKAEEILEMATKNGAEAMGFKNTGILEEGMKADIILVDVGKLHNTPMLNPVAALIYSTKGDDVDTVIVNGKILMEKRELKTIDEEKIIYNANKSAEILFNITL